MKIKCYVIELERNDDFGINVIPLIERKVIKPIVEVNEVAINTNELFSLMAENWRRVFDILLKLYDNIDITKGGNDSKYIVLQINEDGIETIYPYVISRKGILIYVTK